MSRKRIGKNVAYDTEKELYYAYFDGGRGKNGRRERWTRTFRSEREAVQAVETFAAERREGGLPAAEAITVGAWLDYWLEEIVRPNLEYTTYYCYANIIRNHLKPSLGRVLLRELTPLRIQQYYTQMIKGKGLSPNTVHKHHILLHTALKLAFRQEILGSNPVDRVEPPRARAARQLYYTPQELKLLFQAAEGGRMELIVKLAGYLGSSTGGDLRPALGEHRFSEEGALRPSGPHHRRRDRGGKAPQNAQLSPEPGLCGAGGPGASAPPYPGGAARGGVRRSGRGHRICTRRPAGTALESQSGHPGHGGVCGGQRATPHYSPRPAPHLCQCGQQRPHPAAGYQPCAGAQGRGGDG